MKPLLAGLLPGALILALAASASAQHQGHEQPAPNPPPRPASTEETAKEPIPALTDADRAAAFPPAMQGHAVHDRELRFQVLFDKLEWDGGDDGGPGWDNTTWIGGDVDRLWLRSEGESHDGRVERAFLDVLWGRKVSRWWDVVGGVRQDVRPGPAQTWIGGGVQGLAPYFFHVEATGYAGAHGRTLFRLEADYELLLTNRLIVEPTVEAEFHGKSDSERGVGRGLSTLEGGLRLRYEMRRELAPFVGVTWTRSFFGTADLARAAGDGVGSARLVMGVRTWF